MPKLCRSVQLQKYEAADIYLVKDEILIAYYINKLDFYNSITYYLDIMHISINCHSNAMQYSDDRDVQINISHKRDVSYLIHTF